MKTVVGVFSSRDTAERAVNSLRQSGFDNEISIVTRDNNGGNNDDNGRNNDDGWGSVATGTTTGAVVGGIAGLSLAAGALAIPGIGPVLAAGPIAGLLSGVATGGLAGGLIDWGIPKEEGARYEQDVQQGNVLAFVRSSEGNINQAADIMRSHGANRVGIHDDHNK